MTTLFENFYAPALLNIIAQYAVFIAETNTGEGKFNRDADEADHFALEAKLAEYVDEGDYPAPILLDLDFDEIERAVLLAHFNKNYNASMLAYEIEAAR